MNRSLWKQRNFMLLWSGQLVSWVGTEVSGIVLPLVVLALTGSPAVAGRVAAIRGLVYVCWAIPAGALIDRWDRRTVMVIANLGSGLAMGSIALAMAGHYLSLKQLSIASAIEGSFFVFANLGRFASLPNVVPREQFPAAAAQTATADNISNMVGPPLGGFLYQTAGGSIALFLDTASYFVNAFSIFFINTPLRTQAAPARTAMRQEIREALVWFWRQPLLRFLNLLTAGRTILNVGLYLLLIVLAKERHTSSFLVGAIFAVGAGGGIAGSFVAARIHNRFTMKQILTSVTFLSFCIFGLYSLTRVAMFLAAITALFYGVDALYNVETSSYSAKLIPDAMRGRVLSLSRLLVLGSHSFGFFITGVLLQYRGSNWTIGIFSCLLFGQFIATSLNSRLARD